MTLDPPSTVSPRAALAARRDAGQTSIVPYLTAGYPDWERFDRAAAGLAAAGADVFELGVPFSDPLADGPTIQRSSQSALEQGVTLEKILAHVGTHRESWGLPVVLMTYVNPILAYGVERFCEDARAVGVGGVLISDLPPDEAPDLWAKLAAHSIETAVLVAPTTRAERLPLLARAATGFLYCVSRTGVTGRGKEFATNLGDQIANLRGHSSLPIVVGFGIRSAEDAARVKQTYRPDGVVLGARLIEILEGDQGGGNGAGPGVGAGTGTAAGSGTGTGAGAGVGPSAGAGPGAAAGDSGPERLLAFLSGVRQALDSAAPDV